MNLLCMWPDHRWVQKIRWLTELDSLRLLQRTEIRNLTAIVVRSAMWASAQFAKLSRRKKEIRKKTLLSVQNAKLYSPSTSIDREKQKTMKEERCLIETSISNRLTIILWRLMTRASPVEDCCTFPATSQPLYSSSSDPSFIVCRPFREKLDLS